MVWPLRWQRLMRSLAALSVLLLVAGPPLQGEAASGQVVVGARVAPHVRWQVSDEPARLEITAEDIARGFVEVPAASLRVQTNDPAGFVVVARIADDRFGSGVLTGLERPISIAAGGGFLHAPFRGTAVVETDLRWRLPLSDRLPAGSYAWPLRVTLHEFGRRNP